MNKKDFEYFTYEVGRYTDIDEELYGRKNPDFKPYKEDKSKLVWNVIDYDINAGKICVRNLFEYNWVFLKYGLLVAKKKYSNDFIKFAEQVRSWLQHEYWSRTEYEVIICGWPARTFINQKELDELQKELNEEKKRFEENGYTWEPKVDVGYPEPAKKIDVYTQVMMNWDRFIDYVWNNKRLITEKKLGFKK